MAQKKDATVKVRVLADCAYGAWGDVVEIDASLLDELQARGLVDADPAALADKD